MELGEAEFPALAHAERHVDPEGGEAFEKVHGVPAADGEGVETHVGGQSGAGVYAASKAAVRSMARSLSAELVDSGVRVLTLSPGPTRTPIFSTIAKPGELDALLDYMKSTVPMQRIAEPEEVARAALFLISDDSSFMLGADLVVDGGKSQL